eukprot:TRINITY_DN3067_c0_g1_i2.p1 TRINITY_DN3067_c0_g1~~TRINITY_DN3067_c0_g1_i2.p1  ORF type:complete len:183 (+),score=25.59 TRINITY_DN3067_c0_g1_i2:120-668(+)
MGDSRPSSSFEGEQEKAAEGLWQLGLSTVMVRGVHPLLGQETIKDMIDEDGFAGKYDFLYVPLRKKGGTNTSQLFMNFVSPELHGPFTTDIMARLRSSHAATEVFRCYLPAAKAMTPISPFSPSFLQCPSLILLSILLLICLTKLKKTGKGSASSRRIRLLRRCVRRSCLTSSLDECREGET